MNQGLYAFSLHLLPCLYNHDDDMIDTLKLPSVRTVAYLQCTCPVITRLEYRYDTSMRLDMQ